MGTTKTLVSSMVRVSETLVCLMVNETRALTGLDVKPPTTIAANDCLKRCVCVWREGE